MIDALIQGFENEVFGRFLNSKFSGSFSASCSSISIKPEFGWERAERLGIVKTLAGPHGANRPLLVVVAKLRDGETLKERSSRIKQFKFAKQVLDSAMSNSAPGVDGVISQGLFVFYDEQGNFRLSLVFGKADGTQLYWSTAKRLSFYVEAGAGNKTFRDRTALDWHSFDKLKEAFSVEKLTKEFYGKLFGWYQRAMDSEEVLFPNDLVKDKETGEVKSEQIIRLITRLMFVWFLKQKHLVPDHLFDPERLKTILKDFKTDSGESYYRAILQNLFFATLNSGISERAFAVDGNRDENEEHFGVKMFYRYAAEFDLAEERVIQLFANIPFLNGGLFECLDRDNHYYDGFSRRKSKQARVPNRLFFDEAEGLIPLLNQYNFTVEENSPGDEEVALDPELLGKVFENLLGAYNPETKVAARNATGSFYTPREIVNYMVDESLIAHLSGKCGEEYAESIRKLFTDSECPADTKLCKAMDQALVRAKILDPACGSGAFPMGILLRMVEVLRVLRKIPEDESVYNLKLELIENCIYGGDIQCIAVQISKLRFFISLVCEQKPTNNAKDNYGIHTLPNLETKFVAADSLIGLPSAGKDVLELCTGDIAELKTKLWEVRHRHFLAKSYQQKKDLRKEDKQLRNEIKATVKQDSSPDRKRLALLLKEREKVAEPKWVTKGPKAKPVEMFAEFDAAATEPEQTQLDANADARKKLDAEIDREQKKVNLPSTEVDKIADMLADWDPYDQNSSASFSDSEWMYNVKDGFDVVIGNPPYISHDRITGKNIIKKMYRTWSPFADIYCYFVERGILLLQSDGVLSYITSNSYIKAEYGLSMRKMLGTENTLRALINIEGSQLFESAIVNTAVVIVQKSTHLPANVTVTDDSMEDMTFSEFLEEKSFFLPTVDFSKSRWILASKVKLDLLDKLRNSGQSLEVKGAKIRLGIATGSNAAFLIDECKRDELLSMNPQNELILKPILRGRDINRYSYKQSGLYIILSKNGVDIKRDYPDFYKHLDSFGEAFKNRGAQGQNWWNLRACNFYDDFKKEKIVWIELTDRARFTLCREEIYCINSAYFMLPPPGYESRVLLSILNSTTIHFFVSSLGETSGMGTMRWINNVVAEIPIPHCSSENKLLVTKIVDQILTTKKSDPSADTSALETEIDQLVYKLYGLTPEEIKIVEESGKAGRRPAPLAGKSKVDNPAKRVPKKRKPKLPPSLPGWD